MHFIVSGIIYSLSVGVLSSDDCGVILSSILVNILYLALNWGLRSGWKYSQPWGAISMTLS